LIWGRHFYFYLDKKRESEDSPYIPFGKESHEVLNRNSSVVTVASRLDSANSSTGAFSEGVRDHAVAGLEADLGLEGVLSNCTYHL